MSSNPIILPRPNGQGPIPIPDLTSNNTDVVLTITEQQLKNLKWVAFNQGYNDGFIQGFERGKKMKKMKKNNNLHEQDDRKVRPNE